MCTHLHVFWKIMQYASLEDRDQSAKVLLAEGFRSSAALPLWAVILPDSSNSLIPN